MRQEMELLYTFLGGAIHFVTEKWELFYTFHACLCSLTIHKYDSIAIPYNLA